MATRKAIASGNWSDPAIWDGGVSIPDVADDVYSNTFTVVVDGSYTVLSVRNTTATGVSAGGSFTLQNGFTLTADMYSSGIICLNWAGGAGTSTTVIGNLFCAANGYTINHSGAGGTLNVAGNITMNGNDSRGINVSGIGGILIMVGNITVTSNGSSGIVNSAANQSVHVTGNITNNSTSNNCRGINSNSTATITVIGDCTGGANISNSAAISEGLNVTITGTIRGGSIGAAITNATTNAVVTITGAIYACTAPTGNYGAGIIITSTLVQYVFLTGPFISNQFGYNPLFVYRFFLIPSASNTYEFRDNSTAGSLVVAALTRTLYPIGVAGDVPAESDVRSGVSYEFSGKTGTLAVPPAGSVSIGVPVDNTVGTAWLDPQQFADLNSIQLAAFLNNL